MEIINIEIYDYAIEVNSQMQRFIYRCLNMFGPASLKKCTIEQKRELMKVWSRKLFANTDYSIIFDESVWLPDDPSLYGNIALLNVRGRVDYIFYHYRIDFRESWHPIFDTKYIPRIKCLE